MVTQKDVLDIWGTSFWKIPETTDRETESTEERQERERKREEGDEMELLLALWVTYHFKHFPAKSIRHTLFFSQSTQYVEHTLEILYGHTEAYGHTLIIDAHLKLMALLFWPLAMTSTSRAFSPSEGSTGGSAATVGPSCHFKMLFHYWGYWSCPFVRLTLRSPILQRGLSLLPHIAQLKNKKDRGMRERMCQFFWPTRKDFR